MGLFSKNKANDSQKDDSREPVKEEAQKTGQEKPENGAQSNKEKKSMKELYAETEEKPAAKSKAKEPGKGAKKQAKTPVIAYRVLVRPIITEKAADQGAHNKYVFEVARAANKIDVNKAVEEVYGIKPKAVNIVSMKGKRVRYGRIRGQRKDWKKAVVTLPEGKSINIYEGV